MNNNENQSNSGRFYQKTWFTILMLIIFFPVGIVLMWVYRKNWHISVKIIISIFFGLAVISSILNPSESTPSQGFSEGYNDALTETDKSEDISDSNQEEPEEISPEEQEELLSSENTQSEQNETENNKNADSEEITVGSYFETDNLKISIDNADLEFSDFDNELGLYDLKEGMKYIAVSFTFENIGKSDAYVSIYDFNCYADNASCEQQFLPDDSDFINTNLSSGRNISFRTYYAVPIDSQSIELEYQVNMFTEEKIVIKLQ